MEAPETVALINRHYREHFGLHQGWTRDRFNRLCLLLHWTPEELAAVCCIEPRQLRDYLKRNRFPRTASLHFVNLEYAFMEASCGYRKPLVMPVHLLTNEQKHPTHEGPAKKGRPGATPAAKE